MANIASTQSRPSFALPILPAIVAGTLATAAFYGLLWSGVFDQQSFKRYLTSHTTTGIAVWLSVVTLVALVLKLHNTLTQSRIVRSLDRMLDKVIVEGEDILPAQRALWLEARWLSLPSWQQASFVGNQVAEIVERQIRRQHPNALESDVRELASSADREQQASLALVRVALVCVPILGLIGSLCCLSNVLVQAETLAQSGISLSVGLGSAVAPLVVALGFAIPLFFALPIVERIESALLQSMDELIRGHVLDFLTYQVAIQATQAAPIQQTAVASEAIASSHQLADDLLAAVHQLVEMQAGIWSRSISEAQKQWTNWSGTSGEQLREALCQALDKSLTQHALQIEKIQQEAGRQVDSRWQQWQITLSDQARVMHAQQKELVRQTETIDRLVTSTCELKKAEEAMHASFANFELLDQLKQTTLGVGEAVAILATSLERAGIIRGLPVKPRSTRRADDEPLDEQRKVA